MRTFSSQRIFILILLFIVTTSAAGGEELPITLIADKMTSDGDGKRVTATGGVRIIRNELTLLADTVVYDSANGTAEAQGKVSVDRKGDLLRGDTVSLNLGSQQGVISHAFLEIKQGGIRITGEKIEKRGEKEYEVSRGTLTMCAADPPAWRFSASEIDIGERYASGKHVIFSVADIPLLYFPYLLVPVSRERQSGLLIPRAGVSSKKGLFLEIPYYLNINPSQEATLSLDLQSKRGVGTGAEYRYLRPNGGSGIADGYLIYDTSQNRMRGIIQEKHQEFFSPSLSFKSSVELATDQDYLRDYGANSGDYNRQYLETNAFVTKNGEFWSLTPQVKYVYDLVGENNTKTLQQLPTISFTGIKRPLADPLFFSLDSDFTNFYREQGLQGQRLRVAPLLTFYESPSPFLDISISGGYGESLYHPYGAPHNDGNFYGTVTAGGAASSTLTRVYEVNRGGVERLRHVLIPELSYLFVDSFVTTPPSFFDSNDNLTGKSMLTWSLTNYFTGRFRADSGVSEYRELFYLRFSQGYDFRRNGRDLLSTASPSRQFSDLRVESRFAPLKNLTLLTDSRFNVYDVRFSSADVAAEYRTKERFLASLGYHYAANAWDYLEGRIGVPLSQQFALNYIGRYVIPGSSFLENQVSLEYRHQCWGIGVSYQRRSDATELMVTLSLAGIGSVGKMNAY